MIYESQKTPMGNIGVSVVSQELADEQAAQMDANGCRDCTDCTDCSYCSDCRHCRDCNDCSYCSCCSDCSGCSHCRDCNDCSYCSCCSCCSDCSGCSYCSHCSGCSDCSGILQWSRPGVSDLLGLNGLFWPVAISKDRMQIGCRNHTHEEWATFGDEEIRNMDAEAPTFWAKHKDMLLGLCAVKAKMSTEGERV